MALQCSSSFFLSSDSCRAHTNMASSLSWSTTLPLPNIFINSIKYPGDSWQRKEFVVKAAWTRRSRGEAAKRPSRKSWKQRTDMYMRPFLLNIFFSKKFIIAKVMHRSTSKVISVATTNAKDLRNSLPSLTDHNACRVIGKLIAERAMEADVFAVAFEPRRDERIEGKLAIVLNTIKENGIIFV
ncbi:Large ribosomal subunit protein uL18-like protein [Drosera capensis]